MSVLAQFKFSCKLPCKKTLTISVSLMGTNKNCSEFAFKWNSKFDLYILLKIAATLPATPCDCEHSISTIRRLNNYMRCTIGESRLSSLAIMHIKYDMSIDLDEVVSLFEGLHPRMMQLQSLLYQTE